MNKDQAREGYHATIQLIFRSSRNTWDSFRSLLAANTVIVSLNGVILKLYPQLNTPSIILGGLGILVCIAWFLITVRNYDYNKYYFAWARKYEKAALGSKKHVIQTGKMFSDGKKVLPYGIEPMRLSWKSWLFKAEYLMYVVIFFFIFIHVFLLSIAL